MRRYLIPIFLVFLASAIESAFLPSLIPGSWRPGLTLIVASVWAQTGDADGAVAAFAGGLALEAVSGLPLGINTFGMMLGTAVAAAVDRAPVPSPLFRATNWVAVVTLVYHFFVIAVQSFRGVDIDLAYLTTGVLLPVLLFNPLLSIPVFLGFRALRPLINRGGARTA